MTPEDTPQQDLGGSVTPTGHLESIAPREPVRLELTVTDEAKVTDSMELEGQREGEIFVLRKDTPDGRTIAVDLTEAGASTTTTGPMRSKEVRELDACRILVEHLNGTGANWAHLIHTGNQKPESGHDCMARDGDLVLLMQHTQAHHSEALSRRLAEEHLLVHENAIDALADDLWAAIEDKLSRADPTITLVLDASDLGAHSLPAVVRSFVARHGSVASHTGFESVWLVGPSRSLVSRLG